VASGTGERGRLSLLQRPRPRVVRTRATRDSDQTPDFAADSLRARGLAPQERLHAKGVAVLLRAPMHDRKIVDELRWGLRRQDALVFVIALLLLIVAAVAVTYVYWDYGRPFESTALP
jgi:hypothetical protein